MVNESYALKIAEFINGGMGYKEAVLATKDHFDTLLHELWLATNSPEQAKEWALGVVQIIKEDVHFQVNLERIQA